MNPKRTNMNLKGLIWEFPRILRGSNVAAVVIVFKPSWKVGQAMRKEYQLGAPIAIT
jgi:hypothetical protein